MALVICLSLIVLLTAAVLAFFARATANRGVETSRAGRVKAEQVAQSASDYVVSQFLQEMATNSIITTSNNVTIYRPNTASNAIPARKISESIASTDDNFLNLIRQSMPTVDTNVSAISSATASKNGRLVGTNRWNSPALLAGAGFDNVNKLPNWISVEANGNLTSATSTGAIGRFAYNVYNIGGLLDANVAGFSSPSIAGTNLALLKGTLAGADLTRLGLSQSDVNKLVEFRNINATVPASYTKEVLLAALDGFIRRVGTNDGGYANNLFTSRQDLIRYAKTQNAGLTNALPYLTTFARTLNAPSYTPPTVSSINPSLINVRVIEEFPRADGTVAKVGEPLLKSRFPLSRLQLLTRTATAMKTDADPIYKFFGLSRAAANAPWVYDHGDPSRILTLSEVAALSTPREPDFFELLQAGITTGSLGKSLPDGYSKIDAYDNNKYYQVIQIGANIIDQYDADSYPTRIAFDAGSYPFESYGIENLPYMTRIFQTLYRLQDTDEFRFWFQPEIWNPHAQANEISSLGPTKFRYKPTGTPRIVLTVFGNTPGVYAENGDLSLSSGIEFETSPSVQVFAQPTVLDPSLPIPPVATRAEDNVVNGGHNFMGVFICKIEIPAVKYNGAIPTQYDVSPQFQTEINHVLEYWDDIVGDFLPYDRMRRIAAGNAIFVGGLQDNPAPRFFLIRSDPRTNRFGIAMDANSPNQNTTLRPDSSAGASVGGFMGLQADNHPGVASSYTDPDGLVRPADGAFNSGQFPSGYPLATGNLSSRPLILNRPFWTVAELGYASRGMPWKHLDFFDKSSGDTALLDLFCVNETPATAEVAGTFDLNTSQVKVIEAILAGTVKSETDGTTMDSEVSSFAASLKALTTGSDGPLLNPNELVSRWIGNPANSVAANSPDTVIKRRREASVRALSAVGETRTWNLLIDVIAQSGKYLTNGQFQVDGERRYWCQVAIDRYTGKIVSQYLEPVYE